MTWEIRTDQTEYVRQIIQILFQEEMEEELL